MNMKNKYKIKVEIEIPELNLKGEIKPLKSIKLLNQFEQILIENGLGYRTTTSNYKEDDEDVYGN
jgi:hypothetical protein